MSAFAAATATELRAGLAAGQPYPMAEGDRVVWVHPDGSKRLSDKPDSPKA